MGATPALVDANEYMTSGGGRFVKVENFNYVRNFLAATDYPGKTLAAGTYTRDQLLAAYGIGAGVLGTKQYFLGMNDADYIDRAYVFGSGEFEINADAKFVINADGSREILDIAVVPRNDNFDFTSTSVPAQITNALTESRIDPSGIGRSVPIIFTGTVANKVSLTGEDWYAMDASNTLDKWGLWASMAMSPTAIIDFSVLMVEIAASGIIDYKTAEGEFVYYDGKSPSNSGSLDALTGLAKVQLQGTLYDGSSALIGGGGNDRLTGWIMSDRLYGGDGNDRLDGGLSRDSLYGGAGSDTYITNNGDTVKDTDGQGSVQLGGVVLSGGKREEGKSYYYDKGTRSYYFWSGSVLRVARPGEGAITIVDWSNGQLGIRLTEDNPKPPPIVSPIVLDLDSDGIETLSLDASIHFDHAGDGFAERTGWVGADDGLLVRDLNGDGLIKSGKELFGSETLLQSGSTALNGFAALAELDTNHDAVVDQQDLAFDSLRVWRDLNQDGLSDEGELFTLSAAGVKSVATTFKVSGVVDSNGNRQGEVGSYVSIDGSTRAAVDVWFSTDLSDTIADVAGIELDAQVQALPNIEGYGKLRPLQQSMAQDPALKALVTAFVQPTQGVDRGTLVRDILWRWTGADTKATDSRGGYIGDARWLYMVEAFDGQPFIQYAGTNAGTSNPGPSASANIYEISKRLYEVFYARLAAETYLKPLMTGLEATWNEASLSFSVDVQASVQTLRGVIAQDRTAGVQLLGDFVRALRAFSQLDAGVSGTLIGGLNDLVPEVGQLIQIPVPTGFGLDQNATNSLILQGTIGADTLVGAYANDALYGAAGQDSLVGNQGDDILDGGAGNDTLYGNSGADLYVFGRGHGQDVVDNYDQDGYGTRSDRIVYDSTVASADVDVARSGSDLVLSIKGTTDRITVLNFYSPTTGTYSQIDAVQFVDQTVWTADDIIGRTHVATENADRLIGVRGADIVSMKGGNDTVYGNAGDDQIAGEAGDDQISGGEGSDRLTGGLGEDFLDGGAGDDSYIFGLGDGHDVIREGAFSGQSDSGGTDTLFIKGTFDTNSVKISRDRTDIILALPGQVVGQEYVYDSVRLQNVLDNDGNNTFSIERVVFDNGMVWTIADIKSRLISGSDSNDLLEGYGSADELDGAGGNDTLIGNDGADVLRGGSGADQMSGGQGDDELDGGAGNDTLSGGAGNNFYILEQGTGSDVVIRTFDDLLAARDTVLVPFEVGVENVDVRREGADIVFQIKGSMDSIRFKGVMLTDGLFNNYGFQYGAAGGATVTLDQLREALLHGGFTDDVLTGYASDDRMSGGDGNDMLDGAGGIDTLEGGQGDDTFLVDSTQDQVIEAAGQGHDLVLASASYTLSENLEDLTLDEGAYGAFATGNALNNLITGNSSSNVLDGGSGVDTLVGGQGNDTYVLDTLADVIIEEVDGGFDTIETSLSFSLVALPELESIQLTGQNDATAIGNDQGNVLSGNAGNNRLDGGLGADQMYGGSGNDTFVANEQGDTIDEYDGDGIDTIERHFDTLYILESNVENLTLMGTVYRGNGNDLDNVLTGNDADNNLLGLSGNDTLIGGGGADALFGSDGADSLIGGQGDDYYQIDDAGDAIVELAGQGDDFVRSTVSWTLGHAVERLAVDGNADLTVTGNELANGLWGNSGANVLTGGKGNDYLQGGAGNDTYVFDKGDGQDSIDTLDAVTATDTLRINALDSEVLGFKSGNSLFLKIKNSTDQIGFINYYAASTVNGGQTLDQKIDRVQFSNGVVWDQAMLQTVVDRATNNRAPTVVSAIPALTARQGSAFSYTIPVGTVTDPDPWDSITYSVKMADGTAVPAWLNFDPATRVLSGTPQAANLGKLQFVLWGTDNYNYSAGTYVNLTVNPPNNAPVLATALPDQVASEGLAFSYTVAAAAFTDPDAGDALTLGATLADGSALPSWLAFNAATRVFSGTPPVGSTGRISLRVTARDTGNLTASDVFDINVSVANLSKTGTANADTLSGGAGQDTLSGAGGNDTLYGLAGDDRLDGGAGTDSLVGGLGNDSYVVDATADVVLEGLNEGTDSVSSSATWTLSTNVENLTLTGTTAINGTGNALANRLTGNSAVNTLTGADGNDTLDGGAGADSLVGGIGDDVYVVDNASDKTTEIAAQGNDTVQSSITWTLATNLEALELTGTAAINGTGNTGANLITGNAAANTLDGSIGMDTLKGGLGNDTYVVDNAADVVQELAGEGTDIVNAAVTYALSANVENLTLTGTTAINGTGNTGANVLTGNSAVNRLTGDAGNDTLNGGAGADVMVGGLNDDTYIVDNAADAITEALNEGSDVVQSTVTYTLSANVEKLILGGTTALNGTGNAGNNWLVGNTAVNTLTGGDGNDTLDGGAGADFLVGGIGDDVYVVDNANEKITENASQGTDTVQSSLTWTLATNLENLTLTGTTAINGTGNTAANVLTGNSAANTLTGGGGNDTLRGGAGADVLSAASTTSNDTYVWGRGEGADTLTDAGGADQLSILAGVAADQVWLRRVTNNLQVSVIGTTDTFTITNWYTAAANQVERFSLADGKSVTAANAQKLVDAMAGFTAPAQGQTTLPANYQTALSGVIAANWV